MSYVFSFWWQENAMNVWLGGKPRAIIFLWFQVWGWFPWCYFQCKICQINLCLTHWGQDKMTIIFQITFSNAFSWTKMYEFWLKFHWSLFLSFQLTTSLPWFRKYLGVDHGDKPVSEPMLVSLLMHICVTQPQWVKTAICSGFTLIPAWIDNYIHYKMWVEIIYPFPNFNNPHFNGQVITYPCWN